MGYNENLTNIGARIRAQRILQGLTLNELAEKIGVTAAALSRYELGQRKLSIEMIFRISDVLNVSASEIAHFDELSTTLFGDSLFSLFPEEVEDIKNASSPYRRRLLDAFELLNEQGQQIAAGRVEELTEIPKYQAHAPTED